MGLIIGNASVYVPSGSADPHTFPITLGSGVNRRLVIGVPLETGATISSINVNGTALTQQVSITHSTDGVLRAHMFDVAIPDAWVPNTYTVTVDLNTAATAISFHWWELVGCAAGAPYAFTTSEASSNTAYSATLTAPAAGALLVIGSGSQGLMSLVSGAVTLRNANLETAFKSISADATNVTGGSMTVTLSQSASGYRRVMAMLAYEAAPTPDTPHSVGCYAKGAVLSGSTAISRYVYLQTTAGAPATGKLHSDVSAYYVRQGAAPVGATLTAGSANVGWLAGAWSEVDTTRCPGLYRLDWPDAAFATGDAETVALVVKGTGLRPFEDVIPLTVRVELPGEITTGATTTTLPTTGLPTLTTGQLNRRLLQITSGVCLGERVLIVGQASNGTLQVAPPLSMAPTDGDTFLVL